MRSLSSTASELGPRGGVPPSRAAIAPSLSTVGGVYGIERSSRGVSSRATIGAGGAVGEGDTLAVGVGIGIGVGDGAATDSQATRAAAMTMPSRRMGLSLTTAMVLVRMSSRPTRYELVSLSQPNARSDDRNRRGAFCERIVDPPDREIAHRTREGIAREPTDLGHLRAVGDARHSSRTSQKGEMVHIGGRLPVDPGEAHVIDLDTHFFTRLATRGHLHGLAGLTA